MITTSRDRNSISIGLQGFFVVCGLVVMALSGCKKEPARGWHYLHEAPPSPKITSVVPVLRNCEPPYPVSFTQKTENLLGNMRYYWNFGDGTTSTDQNPVHIFEHPGDYPITFIVSNEIGADTVKLKVDGLDLPSNPVVAQFSMAHFNNNNFAPAKIELSNESSGANQFYWYFGDGSESPDENPTHVFAAPGTYTIRLRGMCTNQSADEYTQQVFVAPQPQRVFIDSLSLMLPSSYGTSGVYIEFYHNTTYIGRTSTTSQSSFPVKFQRPRHFPQSCYFDFVQFTANETFRFAILRDNGTAYPDFINEIMLSSADIQNKFYPKTYFSVKPIPEVRDLFIDLYLSY